MIHFDMPREKSNIIKVLGFGGGGGNAVSHMYRQQIQNVDFIVCNTDAQALQNSEVPIKIQLGPHLTQGLGAGANPEVGKQATEESLEEIRRILEVNTKMAFITAGMGGGTGTGGAPTVAKICRELNILTVGIVTTPFAFEGPRRMSQARQGIEELKQHVDTLLVISNDKLRSQFGSLKMSEAFGKADDVLTTAARCITDVINTTGQINVDFADVCTVMRNGGVAILGSAAASGEDRARRAIEAAINSPLLNDNDIRGAKWILLNITAAPGEHEYSMEEVELIQDYVRAQSGDDTDVILGMGYDSDMGDQLGITIIATGFQHKDPFDKNVARKPAAVAAPAPAEEAPVYLTLNLEAPAETTTVTLPAATPATAVELAAEETVEELTLALDMPAVEEAEPLAAVPVATIETTVADLVPADGVEEVEAAEEPTAAVPAPLMFELTLEETPAQQIEEPIAANEAAAEVVEESLVVPPFLSKPAQVYARQEDEPTAEATAEAATKEDSLMPMLSEVTAMPAEAELPAEPAIVPAHESWKPVLTEEGQEEAAAIEGMTLQVDEFHYQQEAQIDMFSANTPTASSSDLSEEEEQKRRAKERINRLRNLSFNPQNLDNNSEFEQVPAYLRRDLNLHNSIANVEDFYSRAQVKSDDNNQANISTLNNFLHGEKPD
ncbi:MAG: cell division protein FtsZ [Chitinophagaceae bacterium]|nr:cell division protein FtsZ [Chitinophagaceae bacterium]